MMSDMKPRRQIADGIAMDMQRALVDGRLDYVSIGEQYRRVAIVAVELDRAQLLDAFHADIEETIEAIELSTESDTLDSALEARDRAGEVLAEILSTLRGAV